ncbi:aldehyde dehydrogenase family protein [Tatumella terrea]|uniref:Aldehyde dehydrogenase family protein n=1 Tax=Tatumella terrea TaxID=419007 RepID=A0ABW1W2D4_9GAMM
MTTDFTPENVPVPMGHYIGGTLVSPAGERQIEVNRPSDGKFFASLPDAGTDTVDSAVCGALQAAKKSGWSTCAPRERTRALYRWAALIEQDELLLQLEAACSTRPVTLAKSTDVASAAETIRFFAELADKAGGEHYATRHSALGFSTAEPYGVIAAITPWNFPLSMAAWKCGPALATGNAMVIKPSEMTPFSTVRLAELAVLAGIPPGILNVIHGLGATAGAQLVAHPAVGKVSFTGSPVTGAAIMTNAANNGIKPVTLELGGKSPQLVFEKVNDLAQVARCISDGFTGNAGQVCVAGTRLIVHKNIANELIGKIRQNIAGCQPGLTWNSASRYSPIINKTQADKIHALVVTAREQGAEILTGGTFFTETGEGAFYRPTLISGVSNDMDVVCKEIFGPVLTIQTFTDEEEGIALANDSVYGLAAGVYTRDFSQGMRAIKAIDAGTVWVNRYGRSQDFIIPTGGFKMSGIGKDLGRAAMEACQRHKSVLIDF